jgi:hypothetical protein
MKIYAIENEPNTLLAVIAQTIARFEEKPRTRSLVLEFQGQRVQAALNPVFFVRCDGCSAFDPPLLARPSRTRPARALVLAASYMRRTCYEKCLDRSARKTRPRGCECSSCWFPFLGGVVKYMDC